MTSLMTLALDGANWELGKFLSNVFSTIKNWGGLVILIIGAAMIVVSVYQVAKALMSHGQGQTSWPKIIIMFLLGGALIAAGGAAASGNDVFKWLTDIGAGGRNTIDQLGGGGTTTILWHMFH